MRDRRSHRKPDPAQVAALRRWVEFWDAPLWEAETNPPAEGDPHAAEHPEETSEERSPGNDQ